MSSADIDMDHLRTWIGKEDNASDVVSARLVEAFCATLDPFLAPRGTDEAPLGLHWCLAPPTAPISRLRLDGHPQTTALLPPVPLPRRMWAGGELDLLAPLRIGDRVVRRSVIVDVSLKSGSSGPLCFVRVQHEYSSRESGMLIRELQDIVYRAASAGAQSAKSSESRSSSIGVPGAGALTWQVPVDARLLFRYSALTFNTHRIHYDYPYATGQEGYRGLVVHGPLQATLLLNIAATWKDQTPRRFVYRSVAPLTADCAFTVSMQPADAQATAGPCCTRNGAGTLTMQGEALWM